MGIEKSELVGSPKTIDLVSIFHFKKNGQERVDFRRLSLASTQEDVHYPTTLHPLFPTLYTSKEE
ncbi:MAG: hypothetical protein V3U07_03840 [Nitrospirales bacterium]